MNRVTIFLLAFVMTTTFFSQECKVMLSAISLSYSGECKDNKAHGKGKAAGQDIYEGEFKAGYPEGKGLYIWKTGDWFEGNWKKGIREGVGEMHFKQTGN